MNLLSSRLISYCNIQIYMKISILFENDDLLVIDKPFGLVVNNADTVTGETVQDWMKKNYEFRIMNYELNKDFYDRNGIVHRLDKETSGCLIIAKNPESFIALQSFFKDRLVKKTYLALVHGIVVSKQGSINVPIARLPWNRERFGVVPGGKEALTEFEVEKYYTDSTKAKKFTLLQLFPKTGRTHQIRVHLKYLGYPIVGDYLYAGRKQQASDRKWCSRVFLHAQKIVFPYPKNSDKTISVESPLPEDLNSILNQLSIQN